MSPLQSFATLIVLAIGCGAAAVVLTDLTNRLARRIDRTENPDA